MTNNTTRSYVTENRISPRLLADYWQTAATKSHENPHMRRPGRARKKKWECGEVKSELESEIENLTSNKKQQLYFETKSEK